MQFSDHDLSLVAGRLYGDMHTSLAGDQRSLAVDTGLRKVSGEWLMFP